MARSGMVRLGPVALVLALAAAPTRAALMHFEFSAFVAEAPAGSYPEAGMETSINRFGTHRPSDETGVDVRLADGLRMRSEPYVPRAFATGGPDATSGPVGIRGDVPAWPGRHDPEPVFGLAFDAAGRLVPLGGPTPADWTGGGSSEAKLHLLRRAYPLSPSTPYLPAYGESHVPFVAETIDSPSATPVPEPPLTLAFMLGVSAWALHRRLAPRRPTGRAWARRVAPARPAGTAMMLASRPRPNERRRADLPRRLETPAPARPLRPLVLAATFVEISTRTGPPALPAWRAGAGATAVSVRRRNSVRRVGA